jgi:hypothetical protein
MALRLLVVEYHDCLECQINKILKSFNYIITEQLNLNVTFSVMRCCRLSIITSDTHIHQCIYRLSRLSSYKTFKMRLEVAN